MKNQKGFSLIELLIVVAIILIIAAIAIPSLMRARIASNESAVVGDIRTVISAEATFQSSAGAFAPLVCLSDPSTCFTAAGSLIMIDTVIADETIDKSGYDRQFLPGVANTNALLDAFAYGGVPSTIGRTGFKGFAGDFTGLVCWTADGTIPATTNGGLDACINTLGRS